MPTLLLLSFLLVTLSLFLILNFQLNSTPYQEAYNLCPTERYVDQHVAAVCTAFLVAPNIADSAGHCFPDENSCAENKLAFDFAIKKPGRYPEKLSKNEVYGCRQILATFSSARSGDFAVIKLDRAVRNHVPLKLNQKRSKLATGLDVFVIGHPAGLPKKIADRGRIVSSKRKMFRAEMNTYAGNSGSPVINAITFEVEGVVVAGAPDFEPSNADSSALDYDCAECRGLANPEQRCNVSAHYESGGDTTELATKISVVYPYIP